MNSERVLRVKERAAAQHLEAVVIMPGPNMIYLTGLDMHLSERPTMLFFPVYSEPFAYCPAFEAERVMAGTGIRRAFAWGDDEGPAAALQRALTSSGLGSGVLGVEYRHMRLLERELLARAVADASFSMTTSRPELRYEDAGVIMADLRMAKDASEIASMEIAAEYADAGAKAARSVIQPGVTERDVAAYMEQELKRLGVEPPFHIAVASGPRSAVPHANSTDRAMQEGEVCWVDFVCYHQGYAADITRTYPVGRISGRLAEIYTICLEAQEKARAEAMPGMSGAQVDVIARAYITEKGYGQYFTHRTGHGLGLEIHEEPYIVGSNHRALKVGHTFTIEPGIYVPGLGGVRIEDDVVMEADGVRSLTRYDRDLRRS